MTGKFCLKQITAVQKAKPGTDTAVQKAKPGTDTAVQKAKPGTDTAVQRLSLEARPGNRHLTSNPAKRDSKEPQPIRLLHLIIRS